MILLMEPWFNILRQTENSVSAQVVQVSLFQQLQIITKRRLSCKHLLMIKTVIVLEKCKIGINLCIHVKVDDSKVTNLLLYYTPTSISNAEVTDLEVIPSSAMSVTSMNSQ
ncbi:hypothetical protein LINPERPRIM_LOCUS21304 [Linum perenne]